MVGAQMLTSMLAHVLLLPHLLLLLAEVLDVDVVVHFRRLATLCQLIIVEGICFKTVPVK